MARHDAPLAWDERARSREPTDFWGQIGRTVRGEPVDEGQIALLVEAVRSGLGLRREDVLLDLCCGNGALSDRLFDHCAGGLGVDFSSQLVDVARRHFERDPERLFVLDDVVGFMRSAADTARFTKALCYGSFAYLAPEMAREMLSILRRRFPAVEACFLGNIADRSLMHTFFDPGAYRPGVELDPGSAIGRWWTTGEVADLAAETGWLASTRRMPKNYFAAHYRFDAILLPA